MRSKSFFRIFISSLFLSAQMPLFAAITEKDCAEKGGEVSSSRGYLRCEGGEYDEEPVLSPDFEESQPETILLPEVLEKKE